MPSKMENIHLQKCKHIILSDNTKIKNCIFIICKDYIVLSYNNILNIDTNISWCKSAIGAIFIVQ